MDSFLAPPWKRAKLSKGKFFGGARGRTPWFSGVGGWKRETGVGGGGGGGVQLKIPPISWPQKSPYVGKGRKGRGFLFPRFMIYALFSSSLCMCGEIRWGRRRRKHMNFQWEKGGGGPVTKLVVNLDLIDACLLSSSLSPPPQPIISADRVFLSSLLRDFIGCWFGAFRILFSFF